MESGFEALPPRAGKRGRKGSTSKAAAPREARPAHGYTVSTDADALREALATAPIYDSAAVSVTPWNEDDAAVAAVQGRFEYLDHTADVMVHSWGSSFVEAYAQAALAVWGYMTEPASVEVAADVAGGGGVLLEAYGADPLSLLFSFLDAALFSFASEDFLGRHVRVLELDRADASDATAGGEAGSQRWRIKALTLGERFERGRHPSGTEVKAITYSAMQVFEGTEPGVGAATGAGGGAASGSCVDAPTMSVRVYRSTVADTVAPAEAEPAVARVSSGGGGDAASPLPAAAGRRRGPVDVYVVVDI